MIYHVLKTRNCTNENETWLLADRSKFHGKLLQYNSTKTRLVWGSSCCVTVNLK